MGILLSLIRPSPPPPPLPSSPITPTSTTTPTSPTAQPSQPSRPAVPSHQSKPLISHPYPLSRGHGHPSHPVSGLPANTRGGLAPGLRPTTPLSRRSARSGRSARSAPPARLGGAASHGRGRPPSAYDAYRHDQPGGFGTPESAPVSLSASLPGVSLKFGSNLGGRGGREGSQRSLGSGGRQSTRGRGKGGEEVYWSEQEGEPLLVGYLQSSDEETDVVERYREEVGSDAETGSEVDEDGHEPYEDDYDDEDVVGGPTQASGHRGGHTSSQGDGRIPSDDSTYRTPPPLSPSSPASPVYPENILHPLLHGVTNPTRGFPSPLLRSWDASLSPSPAGSSTTRGTAGTQGTRSTAATSLSALWVRFRLGKRNGAGDRDRVDGEENGNGDGSGGGEGEGGSGGLGADRRKRLKKVQRAEGGWDLVSDMNWNGG